MKKLKIFSLILVLIMAFSTVLVLSSCSNDEPPENPKNPEENGDKTTYTISVVDKAGAPVKDAVCYVSIDGVAKEEKTTDSNGKAEWELVAGKVATVTLKSVPAQYNKGGANATTDILLSSGATSYTFEVTKLLAFTLRLVDTDGNAVVGANVQICYGESGTCYKPANTDEYGEYTVYLSTDLLVKAKINSVPAGYTNPTGDEYTYFESGSFELEITVPAAE